jgi:hypothetical protein
MDAAARRGDRGLLNWDGRAHAALSRRSHKRPSPPTHSGMLWRNPQVPRRTPPAGFILPCQPLLVPKPPAGLGWLQCRSAVSAS